MSSVNADRCRITVVGPTRTLELAVPTNVALADVLPALVERIGKDFPDEVAGRGVILQRLAEAPLDEDQTVAALGLLDGDLVYLRPKDAPLPLFACDDLIDGVADQVRELPGRWSDESTRRLLRCLAAAPLGLGLAVVALASPNPGRAIAAGAVAVLLLLAAAVASRALDDRPAGLLLGGAAVGYAAAGGLLAPDRLGIGGAHLAMAAAAATATSVLAAAAVTDVGPVLVALAALGAATTLGGLLTTLGVFTPVQAAGIVVVLGLLLSPVIASVAFRLSGMRLPDLPTGAADINRDVQPIPAALLAGRTAAADRYVTALHVVVGLVCAGGLTGLAAGAGWSPPALAGATCALLCLRCRMLTSQWQRLALLVPAVWGVGLLALRGAAAIGAAPRLGVVLAGALLLAFGLLAGARVLPSRRHRPHWGRAAEIGETAFAAGLLPLLLAVLGIYGFVRGLGG